MATIKITDDRGRLDPSGDAEGVWSLSVFG